MDFYKTIYSESRVCRPLLDGMIFFFFLTVLEDDVCSLLDRCFIEDEVFEVVSNMNEYKAPILLGSRWLFPNSVGVF